jgi:hypothetical protein
MDLLRGSAAAKSSRFANRPYFINVINHCERSYESFPKSSTPRERIVGINYLSLENAQNSVNMRDQYYMDHI